VNAATSTERPSGAQLIASAEDEAACAGCGEAIAAHTIDQQERCVRAWNRAQAAAKKALDDMRAELSKQKNRGCDLENKLAAVEDERDSFGRELELRRLKEADPDAAKTAGMRRHAFESLQRFFDTLDQIRHSLVKGYGPSDEVCRQMLDAASAIMFLDEKTRPVVDDLMPAIDAYHALRDLEWFERESYDTQALHFLAIAIVHRCVGAPPRPKKEGF
jgi:hypothetical protein